jgi:hypothetical protein
MRIDDRNRLNGARIRNLQLVIQAIPRLGDELSD